jgi:tRNA dimethylallyltransferase
MIDCIVITGPTGTGKSEYAEALAQKIGGEIINADSAQVYLPLTIGTAKPSWQHSSVPHHLFDCVAVPEEMTAGRWSTLARAAIENCRQRGRVPLVVGGSGFYIASLFFTLNPAVSHAPRVSRAESTTRELYEELIAKDVKRAEKIHPNDRYRILRALALLDAGEMPSECAPQFTPLGNSTILVIDRDDEELKARIKKRAGAMLQQGWREEIAELSPEWRDFVVKKKILGYETLMKEANDARAQEAIAQETWQYVRRQRAFLRNLKKRLDHEREKWGNRVPAWRQCFLTSIDPAVYLGEVSSWI